MYDEQSKSAPSRQPYVEDVLDEDMPGESNTTSGPKFWNQAMDDSRYIHLYPHPAGAPINISQGSTKFDEVYKAEGEGGPWGVFETEGKWQLAKWLLQNVGHNQISKFLDLPIVRLSFPVSVLVSKH
jgi:hypothetical protein